MELILTGGAFLIGLILVLISIPPIINIARDKNLFEPFDKRKVHTKTVPAFGGVAIFIGFTLSSIIATDGLSFDALKYIVASVIMMFFIGLKDDLLIISAQKKLVVQIFAAVILITLGNVRITNLQGILGGGEIGYFTSFIISLVAMVAIINAFNLIDGIDGLASALAILAAASFGTWFHLTGHIQFAILSYALVGSLTGFFMYNVFGNKNKLIMGDSGALIIGLVISALVVKFNEFNILKDTNLVIKSAPSVSFAIIVIPLVDVIRVMIIRILNNRSPFSPDKKHIHHRLLKLVPTSHIKVTLIILAANISIIVLALLLNSTQLNVNIQLILVILCGILYSIIPSVILKFKLQKQLKSEKAVSQL